MLINDMNTLSNIFPIIHKVDNENKLEVVNNGINFNANLH